MARFLVAEATVLLFVFADVLQSAHGWLSTLKAAHIETPYANGGCGKRQLRYLDREHRLGSKASAIDVTLPAGDAQVIAVEANAPALVVEKL